MEHPAAPLQTQVRILAILLFQSRVVDRMLLATVEEGGVGLEHGMQEHLGKQEGRTEGKP